MLPEPEYLFKHVLTQVVVYETLLLRTRKEVHARVGGAIESLYRDRLEEHYEELAAHYGKTDNLEKAVEFLEKAGDKAAAFSLTGEARRMYQTAVGRICAFGDDGGLETAHVDLTVKWAANSVGLPTKDVVDELVVCQEICQSRDDLPRLARVSSYLSYIQLMLGAGQDAYRNATIATKLLLEVDDPSASGIAKSTLGRILLFTGNYRASLDLLSESSRLHRATGNRFEEGANILLLGGSHGLIGNFTRCFELLRNSLEVAETSAGAALEVWVRSWMAFVYMLKGDWTSCIEAGDIAREVGTPIGDFWPVAWSQISRWYGQYMITPDILTKEKLHSATSTWKRLGTTLAAGWMMCPLGEAECISKNVEGGRAVAEEYLKFVPQGEVLGESWAHRILGLADSHSDERGLVSMTSHFRQSIQIAQQREEMPYLSVTHLRYAECLHKQGDLPAALEQLTAAERLFAEMDMTWWSEQAAELRGRIEGRKPFVWFAPYVDGPPNAA
jgi:tetratricopeptide (TPR) repeat protein